MLRLLSAFILLVMGTTAMAASLKLTTDGAPGLEVRSPALYPEGIEFNPLSGEFLLGSIRQGKVVAVAPNGVVRDFVTDPRLRSVVGIRVDASRNRLLVTSSDYGVAERSAPTENFATAALGVYDLASGAPLQFIDLSQLRPRERRFINDLDIDRDGNVYLTDSLAAAILRVTPAGEASVWLTHESFRGEGFNLNGIRVHPQGFLLVAKKSDGKLFRIPLDRPTTFTEVRLPQPLVGTDGLVLTSPTELVAIANRTGSTAVNRIYALASSDGWRSARLTQTVNTEDSYITTGVVRDGRVYASHGWLHTLGDTLKSGTPLRGEFRIQEIGRVAGQ
jgi:sugar lactone lactonase YvrE